MMHTILIIDDDASIGNLEQEVLERAGYAVLRAYSGTEGLLLLKGSRPDLILLDLMLPGLSGEEVLPQLGHPCHRGQRQDGGAGQGRAAAGRRGGLSHEALRHEGAAGPRSCSAAGRDWQRPY